MPSLELRPAWSTRLCGALLAPCLALAPVTAIAGPSAPTVLQAAEEKVQAGDDEGAMQSLSEVITLDPGNAAAYRMRADVAARLAKKYAPGAAFYSRRANDLEHVLALSPNPSTDGDVMRQLQRASTDANQAAKREQRRRRMLPAAMSLGVVGGGMFLASATLLVLANTNVGNKETVHVMNVYSGTFLGIGAALVITAIAFGVTARKQFARDARARSLFEPQYARRFVPQVGAGGLVLHF